MVAPIVYVPPLDFLVVNTSSPNFEKTPPLFKGIKEYPLL